jgi:hypothetical protein
MSKDKVKKQAIYPKCDSSRNIGTTQLENTKQFKTKDTTNTTIMSY